MPIMSYLAYPVQGAREELITNLTALANCEILPSDNEEILILVTDTPDKKSEKTLQNQLKNLKSLQGLSMAFGYADADINHRTRKG